MKWLLYNLIVGRFPGTEAKPRNKGVASSA